MIKVGLWSESKSELIAQFESYEIFQICYKPLNKLAGKRNMQLVHQFVEEQK